MESLLFVEIIQTLANIHQTQHQAFVLLHTEQEQQFQVLLQAQPTGVPGPYAGENHPISGPKKKKNVAAFSPHLTHPMILGTNWPAFPSLWRECVWMGPVLV